MKKLMVACLFLSACIDTGGGDKIGSVVKLAQEGVFCKTWEGQIIRGGLSNGSGSQGAAFDFTIENNPDLVKKIQHYMETNQEVKITYRSEGITWCRSEAHSNGCNNFLVDVTPLGANGERPLKIDSSNTEQNMHEEKLKKLVKIQQELLIELEKK